jgi:hypothetical protein
MGRRLDEILKLCADQRLRIEARLGGLESRFTLAAVQVRSEGGTRPAVTFLSSDGSRTLTVPEEEIAGLRPAPGRKGWILVLDGGTELSLEPEAGPGA